MERYLVSNYGNNADAIDAGLSWLESNGGGVLAAKEKRTLENCFETKTPKGFEDLKRRLMARGIEITWQRDGWRHMRGNNVFALYLDDAELEEIEAYKDPAALYVLSWNDKLIAKWINEYSPTLLPGGNDRPDWA